MKAGKPSRELMQAIFFSWAKQQQAVTSHGVQRPPHLRSDRPERRLTEPNLRFFANLGSQERLVALRSGSWP